jgi:hypothetical protein
MGSEPSLDTYPRTNDMKPRKKAMEEGANWITEAVRDKIYHSIDFPEI